MYLETLGVGLLALLLMIYFPQYDKIIIMILTAVFSYFLYCKDNRNKKTNDRYRHRKNKELKKAKDIRDFNQKIINSIIEILPMPIIYIEKHGSITFINEAFKETFKLHNITGKQYRHALDKELFDIINESYVFEKEFNGIFEINQKYYQINGIPLKHAKQFAGMILLFVDISVMKQNEKMQKQFLSNISHELKTPLSAIIGSVEILSRLEYQDEMAKEFVEIVLKESNRMQLLIHDILELSRLEQHQKLHQDQINVKNVVDETMKLFSSLAQKKSLIMKQICLIENDILIDNQSLRTILNNLISNAIKYSNQGMILITTYLENEKLICIVYDQGKGIAAKALPFIYDRFYQTDDARSAKTGTGLGLSIVKRIINLNKGFIDIQSVEGEGTICYVELPCNTTISHNLLIENT